MNECAVHFRSIVMHRTDLIAYGNIVELFTHACVFEEMAKWL